MSSSLYIERKSVTSALWREATDQYTQCSSEQNSKKKKGILEDMG
jgi:hypothetical protein